jgi:hypothetical protein
MKLWERITKEVEKESGKKIKVMKYSNLIKKEGIKFIKVMVTFVRGKKSYPYLIQMN